MYVYYVFHTIESSKFRFRRTLCITSLKMVEIKPKYQTMQKGISYDNSQFFIKH